MSQAELARRSGVSPSELTRLKKGAREPSLSVAIKLADALDVTLDFFSGRKGGIAVTRKVLAAESLELFCQKRNIPRELRNVFEELALQEPSAPTTVEEWANVADQKSFFERYNRTVSKERREPDPESR